MGEADGEGTARIDSVRPHWPGWLAATAACVRFFSRLPVPPMPGEADIHALPDFRAIPRALPLAGLVIALPASTLLLATGLAGLSPVLCATLAVTALVMTTGALHEDGLADSADGLFGGHERERRLAIMKDSRVGSFGALALGLSLLLRVTAVSGIMDTSGAWAAAAMLLAAAASSRAQAIRLMANTPFARPDGAAAAVGRPDDQTGLIGLAIALALSAGLCWAGSLPLSGVLIGWLLGFVVTSWLRRLTIRLIGGQTGDIIGTAQQLSEIAFYLGLALALGWSGR